MTSFFKAAIFFSAAYLLLLFNYSTATAVFIGGKSIDCKRRPSWKNNVDKKFKKISANQFPSTTKPHLAHVVSWKEICENANSFVSKNKWDQLRNWVKKIFEIDANAGVWVCGKDKCARSSPTFTLHKKYIGTELEGINAQFESEALGKLDNIKKSAGSAQLHLKDLYRLMYSAPANLRYGDSSQNLGIGKRLDPMGDSHQKLTLKEKSVLTNLNKPNSPKGKSCKKCTGDCSNAWRSSSASSDNKNYYVCKS